MTRHREEDCERRREPRAEGSGMRACFRTGHRLTVIDLSALGALVEAERALRPGSHVHLYLETDRERRTVSARVVRCAVAAINAEAGIVYRAALSFIEACEWVREALTPGVHGVRAALTGTEADAGASGDVLPALLERAHGAPAGGSK